MVEKKTSEENETNGKNYIPDDETILLAKLKRASFFTKAICWLYDEFTTEKEEFIYSSDLAKAFKISVSVAIRLLEEIRKLGLIRMQKLHASQYLFKPSFEDDSKTLKLEKYIKSARKTCSDDFEEQKKSSDKQ